MKLLIPPPVQALICAGLIWLIAKFLPEFSFSFELQQPVAILISLLGVCIDLMSVGLFIRAKTTISPLNPEKAEKLVVSGFYKYTRNPMYLGMAIILTGLALFFGNYASFLMIPCFVWALTNLQIIPEEEILLETFGEEYGEYMLRVRRWI